MSHRTLFTPAVEKLDEKKIAETLRNLTDLK